ncbi:MAG: UDP-3-O-(3-hydroxymyristoyl)glucosamine N-acyltransferase [Planctomycetes bacterium]|nr:UDP-3-O-(3-hydroxymyristoyl)glucosamine N-acyltransferase [Planctomycetota bacterium]
MPIRLDELAKKIGATLHGDGAIEVHSCAPVDRASAGQVSFVANQKYLPHLATTSASAVIVAAGAAVRPGVARLESADPYFSFRQAMVVLHGFRRHPQPGGSAKGRISDRATIHPEAVLGAECAVHAGAVIERGAKLGARCVVYPNAYIGERVCMGDDCILYPGVCVYDGCVLGHRVTLHANAVIGSDGFGYATHQGRHEKIPQAGIVVLEDDVEIGSCCVIERAAMEETRVGEGTKFADLISIGHGTRIGKHCLLVSLVGISGSVEMGNYVVLGGQVGVTGHLAIGDGVQAAGKAAILTDIPAGQKVAGVPAIEHNTAKRNYLVFTDLFGMSRKLKALEREVAKLQALAEGAEKSSEETP